MVLLLPALVTEFDGAAMPRIIEELKGVDYLDRIVLSLDRADETQFNRDAEHHVGFAGGSAGGLA